MELRRSAILMAALCLSDFAAPPSVIKHVVAYSEPGRYGGWPANHGIWIWGNEILAGFESGYFKGTEATHAIDFGKPSTSMQARSADGGETWTLETPPVLAAQKGRTRFPSDGPIPTPFTGRMNFKQTGFIFTARTMNFDNGPSRFYYSVDRGRNWLGPYIMPGFDQAGICARTDYLVDGKERATLLLTASGPGGREGGIICVRTADGGRNWEMVSQVTPIDEKNASIMPSSVRLSSARIVTAVRRGKAIKVLQSDDDGSTWRLISTPAEDVGSNPASMVRLKDGRLAVTYGFRKKPYGIRARLSSDGGHTWDPEFQLRSDGGTWDLGYPRTVQRPDGKLVTVYYFAESAEKERTIQATIWDPGAPAK